MTTLASGPGWEWLVAVMDGADILVRGAVGTRFGGEDDQEDNGIGASGFPVRANPLYLGVSLPQSGRGIASMKGCPLPKLPWYLPVKVYSHKTGAVAYGGLVDIGPSRTTKHAIDLTNSLVEALGLDLDDGVYGVDYRVIGGAAFLRST